MMLMEQGKLQLSNPVSHYLPEYAAQQVASLVGGTVQLQAVHQRATIKDLLRHTAGLTYEFMGSNAVQRQYAQARIGSRGRSNAECSQTLAALPLMFEPASVWEYSRATDLLAHAGKHGIGCLGPVCCAPENSRVVMTRLRLRERSDDAVAPRRCGDSGRCWGGGGVRVDRGSAVLRC